MPLRGAGRRWAWQLQLTCQGGLGSALSDLFKRLWPVVVGLEKRLFRQMIGFEELPLRKGEREQEGGVGQGPDQARWQGDFPAPDEAPHTSTTSVCLHCFVGFHRSICNKTSQNLGLLPFSSSPLYPFFHPSRALLESRVFLKICFFKSKQTLSRNKV